MFFFNLSIFGTISNLIIALLEKKSIKQMFPICTLKCCMYLEKDSICLKKWQQKFAKQIKFKDSIYGKGLWGQATVYQRHIGIQIWVYQYFC